MDISELILAVFGTEMSNTLIAFQKTISDEVEVYYLQNNKGVYP